jgi:hypothetical protein
MENPIHIRFGWLKFMYIYTALGAGLLGFGMLAIPGNINSILNLPVQDPINFGIVGSAFLAFGLISILGLRFPLKFIPILLLQFTYKMIWFIGVILPLLIKGQLPTYALIYIFVFATYVIGDIIAIPFRLLFSNKNSM